MSKDVKLNLPTLKPSNFTPVRKPVSRFFFTGVFGVEMKICAKYKRRKTTSVIYKASNDTFSVFASTVFKNSETIPSALILPSTGMMNTFLSVSIDRGIFRIIVTKEKSKVSYKLYIIE